MTKGQRSMCAVKLDMSKAYDRIEWHYLRDTMRTMGFAERWIDMIMKCVSTPKFQVVVNGRRTETFTPSRGLRQGDPLSPYLFVICAEGLSAMLTKAATPRSLQGVKVARNAPPVSHLFFADDSIIFMKANATNAGKLKRILDQYCMSSGQRLNHDKSTIMFSPNTEEDVRQRVKENLGINSETCADKYLGLPTAIGERKNEKFRLITERVQTRLQGWKEKALSFGGKEVLVKAVIQAIPTYSMQCFLLTKKTCNELARLANRFWWGNTDEKTKIHWKAWYKMAIPKSSGGLGFRDFELFNQALLAKQGWRIIQNPTSLCSRIFKAKYFPNSDFMEATGKAHQSYTWRSILHGREALSQGIIWRIGDGRRVKIWEDPWVPDLPNSRIQTEKGGNHIERVSELVNPETGTWKSELIEQIFSPTEAQAILAIPLAALACEDRRGWCEELTGIFSVKSCYRTLVAQGRADESTLENNPQTEEEEQVWRAIYSLEVPSKINNFLWRLAHQILPTKSKLRSRRMPIDPMCSRCNTEPECCLHAVWGCQKAQEVWQKVEQKGNISVGGDGSAELDGWMRGNLLNKPSAHKMLFAVSTWMIWNERNNLFAGKAPRDPKVVVEQIFRLIDGLRGCQTVQSSAHARAARRANTRWREPPEHWFKLNVDFALDKNHGKAGLGAIIRDSAGCFMAGRATHLHRPCNVLIGEARALLDGLNLALEMGYRKIEAESDSSHVISLIQSIWSDLSPAGAIIRDIKNLMCKFEAVSISHVFRECNSLAHESAKFAVSSNQTISWLDNVPEFIQNILIGTTYWRDE